MFLKVIKKKEKRKKKKRNISWEKRTSTKSIFGQVASPVPLGVHREVPIPRAN